MAMNPAVRDKEALLQFQKGPSIDYSKNDRRRRNVFQPYEKSQRRMT